MGSNKVLVGIAVSCIAIAAAMFFVTSRDKYDTKGKKIFLKCGQCGQVVEMEADKYEDSMREMTDGLSTIEIMAHPHLYLDCSGCGERLWIALKNPQTNEVEIIGRPK